MIIVIKDMRYIRRAHYKKRFVRTRYVTITLKSKYDDLISISNDLIIRDTFISNEILSSTPQ
jgi:hypothetical protein